MVGRIGEECSAQLGADLRHARLVVISAEEPRWPARRVVVYVKDSPIASMPIQQISNTYVREGGKGAASNSLADPVIMLRIMTRTARLGGRECNEVNQSSAGRRQRVFNPRPTAFECLLPLL